MFKITAKKTFDKKITARQINDKGGYTEASLTLTFHRLNQTEIDELIAEISARPDDANDTETRKSDIGYAKRLIAGFGKDVCDEDGEPLPFDDNNLDLVLNEPGVAAAAVRGFFDVIGGLRGKN